MAALPTVGSVVHFYPSPSFDGRPCGPLAAIVTRLIEGSWVDLTVLPPFSSPYGEGTVGHRDDAGPGSRRYWSWIGES